MHLRCEGITKSFGPKAVLRDVQLETEPGKISVIIGPNGAGKTTLLRILALLENPDRGHVLFDGHTARMDTACRRNVVMAFQEPILLDRTVAANLAYGLKRRKDPDVQRRVSSMLKVMELEHLAEKNADQISGGQKKRTALGMALLMNAPILLLDECFANLDPLSTKILEDLLLSLRSEGRKTILLATHSLLQARRHADVIYVLKDGNVLEKGKPHDIFNRPSSLYTALYVGHCNVFEGNVENVGESTYVTIENELRFAVVTGLQGRVHVSVPPTDILISSEPLVSSALNSFQGTTTAIQDDGMLVLITVDVGVPIQAVITRRSLNELNLRVGATAYLTWKASAVHIFQDLSQI